MEKLKKKKIQEILDKQNAAVDADMVHDLNFTCSELPVNG